MFSIRSSRFSDCSRCRLLQAPSCIAECNCPDDLSMVEVVFIAENPGYEEVRTHRPLIGRAGKVFRKFFEIYNLETCNYLLSNVVLCQTVGPDGRTTNPDPETIENCKRNVLALISKCNPKLIVLMGASACSAFGLTGGSITQLRGSFYRTKIHGVEYPVFVTFHPSYILRNPDKEGIFSSDFRTIASFLGKEPKLSNENNQQVNEKQVKSSEIQIQDNKCLYRIPEKYYSERYALLDIQIVSYNVVYIFRDCKTGCKEIYTHPSLDYYYYVPKEGKVPKLALSYLDLQPVITKNKPPEETIPSISYEADIGLDAKHALDYYHQKKDKEPTIDLNIMFIDIEVYSRSGEFSSPETANDPIVLISYSNYKTNKIETIFYDTGEFDHSSATSIEDTIFVSKEEDMLRIFSQKLKEIDPDVISGWNLSYDLTYITKRMERLGLDPNMLSPLHNVRPVGNLLQVAGFVCLDLKTLYEGFSQERKESYSLEFIANAELGKGKLKVDHGGRWYLWYEKYSKEFILYNKEDISLLLELENKLLLISLQNELRRICCTTFRCSLTTIGQVDGLILSYLKNMNLAAKTLTYSTTKKQIVGAFVLEPSPGLYRWVVDFDFSSLYPSLILTYNIGPNSFVGLVDKEVAYQYCYNKDKFSSLPQIKLNLYNETANQLEEKIISGKDFLKLVSQRKIIVTISGALYLRKEVEESYYLTILSSLLQSRKQYKKQMFDYKVKKDKQKELRMNIRQLVYKILANSMYGVLANEHFRFYNPDIAESITMSGQEAIKCMILQADKYLKDLYAKNTREQTINPDVIEDLDENEKVSICKNFVVSKKLMFESEFERELLTYVITGDTDSIFFCLDKFIRSRGYQKEKTLSILRTLCDYLDKFLNNISVQYLVERHNIPVSQQKLQLKNELVISRGLFLAKKRYAIHVISNEGRDVDTIETRGVETRRSDFPHLSKVYLGKLLEIVLKQDFKVPSLLQKVNEMGTDIMRNIKEGNKCIARPVSFAKPLSGYKKIPQGVIAMLNWNNLMFESFRYGTKGYMFKIKGINSKSCPADILKKYNEEFVSRGKEISVIAIPDYIDKLPDFFIIDQKEMYKFCWEDRWKLLLEPIIQIQSTRLATF